MSSRRSPAQLVALFAVLLAFVLPATGCGSESDTGGPSPDAAAVDRSGASSPARLSSPRWTSWRWLGASLSEELEHLWETEA